MLIDSHAHLTSNALYSQIDSLLLRSQEAKVSAILNICTDSETLERGLAISKKHPKIYLAGATTPHDVQQDGQALFPLFEKHAKGGDFIAIGETGLDYYYTHSPVDLQKHYFQKYIQLAIETHIPLVIHCRDAFDDLLAILKDQYISKKNASGVLHCFTGTLEEAKNVLALGWKISFSGIITFKKSHELREIVKYVPLESILVETDSPYLAPQPYRGKTNEPSYVTYVAKCIAETKNISFEKVCSQTTKNFNELFLNTN